jgi:hypothetical protein
MRARGDESRAAFWLFVDAPRLLFVAVTFVGLFFAIVLVGVLLPDAGTVLREGDPIETAFQSFVGATITGVTLVLTLNQLVLSQELGAVGDQRERMEGAMSFRRDVASMIDPPVSPANPAAFLRALVTETLERAQAVREGVSGEAPDEETASAIETLVDNVEANATGVRAQLDDAEFGTFEVLSAALDFDYSWKLYRARWLREAHADELSEASADALDDLVETLELFGPAREHFKTLYFQWELITLSRTILASALPALVAAVSMVLYYDPPPVVNAVAGVPVSVLVVAAAVAVSSLPFLVLLAYVLRIATVTKRTLSIGPFTLRGATGERGEESE